MADVEKYTIDPMGLSHLAVIERQISAQSGLSNYVCVLLSQSDDPRPVCSQDQDVAGVWESRLGASEVNATSALLEWSRDDIVMSSPPMYSVEFRQQSNQLFNRANEVCITPLPPPKHTFFLVKREAYDMH